MARGGAPGPAAAVRAVRVVVTRLLSPPGLRPQVLPADPPRPPASRALQPRRSPPESVSDKVRGPGNKPGPHQLPSQPLLHAARRAPPALLGAQRPRQHARVPASSRPRPRARARPRHPAPWDRVDRTRARLTGRAKQPRCTAPSSRTHARAPRAPRNRGSRIIPSR